MSDTVNPEPILTINAFDAIPRHDLHITDELAWIIFAQGALSHEASSQAKIKHAHEVADGLLEIFKTKFRKP